METNSIYIPPNTEDYAGYSTFVFTGSITSSFSDLHLVGEGVFTVVEGEGSQEEQGDVLFPEAKGENILDEDLMRFYEKKGYKI